MISSRVSKYLPFKTLFLLAFLLLFNIINIKAQFIDLQLNVDSKIEAKTEQNLKFESFQTNSGRQEIELGSNNMGIFSLTALENQTLMINLNFPNILQHNNPAVDDLIPLELSSRYGFSAQDPEASFPLHEGANSIQVEPNPEPGPWNSIYIFIYGSLNIGNVQEGTYSNDIVLNVEYI